MNQLYDPFSGLAKGGFRDVFLLAFDAVFFDFAIEGGAAEAEEAGGFGDGAIGALESFVN